MKTLLKTILFFSCVLAFAQVPETFSYRSIVFEDDNTPLKDTEITVNVEVLNSGMEDAKVLYEERHTITTNERGQYFLQIGSGKPLGENLKLIDVLWAEEGEKYIRVKVYDSTQKLISNGVSQLNAVPYALVAKELAGSQNRATIDDCDVIDIVNNIADLKTYKVCNTDSLPKNGDIVYVKRFSGALDYDGGGMFMFQGYTNPPDADGKMIIKYDENEDPTGSLDSFRWVRRNVREVSIAFYGAHGNDTQDDTAAIQGAIDYVHSKGGGVVYFPKGRYLVNTIILRNRVSLKGEFGGTYISPKTGSSANALVELDDTEPVTHITIDGFNFLADVANPDVEVDMHCFALNATLADENDGGLWFSSFKNIDIRGFKKNGFRFQGGLKNGPNDPGHPNQFITMENVRVFKTTDADSRALYMHGQNGQFTFINCSFSGGYQSGVFGTNVEIRSPDISQSNPEEYADEGPFSAIIRFDTCTFENADTAILINYCLNINIDSCWFENLNKGIGVYNKSLGINVSNNRFTNTHDYSLKSANSSTQFTNNTIRGTYAINNVIDLDNISGSHHHFYGKNNNKKTTLQGGTIIFFDQ